MKNYSRLICFVVALVAVAVAAAVFQSTWARNVFLNGWRVDEALLIEQKKAAVLDEAAVRMGQEQADKVRALQDLHEGRATLIETAAVFYRLNRNHPDQDVQRKFPECAGCSEEELVCRQVISYIGSNYPKDAERLVPRLEEELLRHKQRYGAVILLTEKPKAHKNAPKDMNL